MVYGKGVTEGPGRRRCVYRIFVAGRGVPPPAAPVTGAQQCEIGEHLDDEHDPGGAGRRE